MPVTEFYAFNLIYENLLAALYGVALDHSFCVKLVYVLYQIADLDKII